MMARILLLRYRIAMHREIRPEVSQLLAHLDYSRVTKTALWIQMTTSSMSSRQLDVQVGNTNYGNWRRSIGYLLRSYMAYSRTRRSASGERGLETSSETVPTATHATRPSGEEVQVVKGIYATAAALGGQSR